MHHKQQLSSPTSHGLKSVGHDSTQNSTTQNRADTQRSCGSAQDPAGGLAGAARPEERLARPRETALPQWRCEALRSPGPDPTGEAAIACGARADVVCEFCGPLCLHCAEETFCFYGEHRLSSVEAMGRDAGQIVALKPLFKVVYVQLSCANCGDVRMALPAAANPRSGIELACPECATPGLWRYLAHGLTQRELPFYERFTLEEEEDPEKPFKPRVPWDRRSRHWEE